MTPNREITEAEISELEETARLLIEQLQTVEHAAAGPFGERYVRVIMRLTRFLQSQ